MVYFTGEETADHKRKEKHSEVSSSSTISSYIHNTVTVGTGSYLSPLSITSAGKINPSEQAYAATGLVLAVGSAVGTITNSGAIYGGYGANGYPRGGAGGTAVELASAFLVTNKGVIAGGNGGYSEDIGGSGGTGVAISATGTFTNSGQIDGGNGGYGYGGGTGFDAGVGIYTSATLINSGTIRGGYGGGVVANVQYGARGGYGLFAVSEDVVKNTGLIIGGAGGNASADGGYGAVGALFDYGTLNNGGTILGGAGGVGGLRENDRGLAGGRGVYLMNASTATNTGVIRGGNGNYGRSFGGDGGDGVYLQTYGSMVNSGTITGGAGGTAAEFGGHGGIGLAVTAYSTASNSGMIDGGNGGATNSYYNIGGTGGVGVFISQSSFTNTGKINGGAGGTTKGFKGTPSYNIPGGDGLDASSAVVTNSGIITGGTGAGGFANGGTAGTGGIGVSLNGTTFTNTGTIMGGIGGTVPQSQYNNAYGGVGGAGVFVDAGATLVNDKLIKGGTGGTDIYAGNTGGDGVIIDGGVFTNVGTVTQGYGGVSQSHIVTNGDAVFFAGAGTLVAAPGAKFVGSVVSSLTSGSVLELTGSSSTALTGIGSQFIGINLISFATGATRAVEGSLGGDPQSNNHGAVIAGFAAHDTIVIDGFAAIPSYTYIQTRFSRIDLKASGGKSITVDDTNLLARDLEVTAGGGKTTLTGLGTTATTLASGAAEFVRSGGTASGRISKGAVEEILTGGTVTATTIAGGDLTLLIGAKTTGTISFSGTGGILKIESANIPTGTIASFVSGDTIELSGITYNASDKVTVGTAGTVTITAPGISYKLDIANATKGESSFKFSAGSLLTTTAAAKPAMAFLAPETAAAAQAGSWAPDMANPFTLTAFPELPAETSQGLTLFAHYEPALSYGMGQSACERSDPAGGLETAVIRHAGTSPW